MLKLDTLSKYNFWSRIDGTLYGIRAFHPRSGRLTFAYGGKTFQHPWTKRIDQHLWGRGTSEPAKPWAHTVPGWRPNGRVEEVIAAGGVFVIFQGRVSPFGLWWREILFAIWLRLPLYNNQHNLHNPRRLSNYAVYGQRFPARYRLGRVVQTALAAFMALGALAFVASGGISWLTNHGGELGAGFVLACLAAVLCKHRKPRRRRRNHGRRKYSRRRGKYNRRQHMSRLWR